MPPEPSPFAVGRVLGGRYRLIEPIGQGGMGAVYAAVQLDLARRVAVKVLLDDTTHEDILRFRQEALAAAALRHPNIVQVTDFRHDPGEPPFIVMEALDGESLRQLLYRDRTLPAPRALFITKQILAALGAAHAARIIHRDIKPANVFLGRTDAVADLVKVLDFGIAKMLGKGTRGVLTREGEVHGTPAYMAPEQVLENAVDHRADIHAVGVCLFEMLSGQRPYYGATAHETLRAIVRDPPRRLLDCAPHVDPRLAAIVDRAVAKDPLARPGSAAAFIEMLAPFAHGQGATIVAPLHPSHAPVGATTTVGTGPTMSGPATVLDVVPPFPPQPPPAPPARSSGALLSLGLAGAIVLLGLGGVAIGWRLFGARAAAGGDPTAPVVTMDWLPSGNGWSSSTPPLVGNFVGDDTEDYAGVVSDESGSLQHGTLAVFDGATHRIVWTEPVGTATNQRLAYAAVDDQIAIRHGVDKIVFLDAATGTKRRSVTLPRAVVSVCSPAGAKGSIWVGMGGSGVFIDARSGETTKAPVPSGCADEATGGPLFCQGRLCGKAIASDNAVFYTYDLDDELRITSAWAPQGDRDKVDVKLFERRTGKERWARTGPAAFESVFEVGGGRVFVKRGKELVVATGIEAWDFQTGKTLWVWDGKPLGVGGQVADVRASASRVYLNRRGGLTILDAKSGKELQTISGF